MIKTTSPARIVSLCLAAALLHGCAVPPVPPQQTASAVASADPAVREALAPTGRLRIAVYPGSPTSMVRAGSGDAEARGLSVDIGRELARRLGVPADLVVLDRAAQVVEALRAGQADVTITNATAARALLVNFTAPLVGLELGYLVPPGSAITAVTGIDRPGVRMGVTQGSSSQAALGRQFSQAVLVPAESLAAAAEMLRDRRIDAFATNKGILFDLADKLPGARVLDGRWGVESLALAVPQGRRGAAAFLESFIEDVRGKGLVRQAAERAGLRGVTEPQPH